MAEYSKLITTTSGKKLLAKAITNNAGIDFTRIVSSSATYQLEELENLTELTEIQQSSLISAKEITSEPAIKVQAAFSNVDLQVGYYMRTLGLYAKDLESESEILYAVTIEETGKCYMPAYNGVAVSGALITLITTISDASNVTLNVNPAATATIKDINNVLEKIVVLSSREQEDINILQAQMNNLMLNATLKDIQSGREMIEYTEAGTTMTYEVTFDTPFSSIPVVVATPISGVPNKVEISVKSITENGFTIVLYRTEASNTEVGWVATTEVNNTQNLELIDARVAYNGTTYPSAGDAVRGQITTAITAAGREKALNEILWDSQNIYSSGTVMYQGILRGYDKNQSPVVPVYATGVGYEVWKISLEGLTQLTIPFENSYPDETRVFMLIRPADGLMYLYDALIELEDSVWIEVNSAEEYITLTKLDYWYGQGYTELYVTMATGRQYAYVSDSVDDYIKLKELTAMRTGFDGTTYPSAGDAVRGQITTAITAAGREKALNEILWDSQNIYSNGTVLLDNGILKGYSTSDFTPVTLSGYTDYQVWSISLEGLTQVDIPFENEYPNSETRVFILSSDSSAMAFTQSHLLESTANWISVNSDKKTVTLSNLDWWMKAEHGGYHTLYVTISRNRPAIYVPDTVANHITAIPERFMVPDERIVAYNQLRMIEDGTITLFADNALYGARASKYAAVCFDVQGCTDYVQMDDRLIIRGAGIDATNGATVTVNYCKHNVHKVDLSKTIALYTVSKSTNADVTKKVLVIGDSWTNGATWLHYLVDNFTDDSTNLELLGTRPGDTTYTSGIWKGEEKPNHEGRGGWNAYAYCNAQSHNGFENAFWNPDTETFDFSYYMEQQGYDDVDIVILALGMNAITVAVDGYYPTTDEDVECLKMMVESIKAYNSDVTVGIWLTPPPGQANGDHLILEKDKRLLVNESVIQTFANSGYYNQRVYLIPTNIVMDTTWGYPCGERAVSESIPCTSESTEWHKETYHTEIRSTYEALHPNYVGNQQVANIVYAYIKLL